ncbi:MAG: gliding motility-associated C-terminal domain-containing protein [Bacteroidales bacterium]|nr:gliding motility-associated C-terminal domain-containing protein [Bacteroidales bacterium]
MYEYFEDTDSVLIINSPASFSSNSGNGSCILRNTFNARFRISVYCNLDNSNVSLGVIKDSIIHIHNKKLLVNHDTLWADTSMNSYLKLEFMRNQVQGFPGTFVAYISLVCIDNLAVSSLSSNSATISWDDFLHSTNEYTIAYNKVGSEIYDTLHTSNSGIQLNNLENNTSYFVYVTDRYGNTISKRFRTFCEEDLETVTDFSNIYSCNVTCRYGTFLHPDTHEGIVDFGIFSEDTEHCINIGVGDSTDARTNNQLRIIPEGENYSIRLGNWYFGKGEESITYKYKVDTLRYDLLLLKYAAVLQDPDHIASRQPKFTFQILDENGNEINPNCNSANFVSNPNLGWNSVGTFPDVVLWKDWTSVGIDLIPLHGQTIYIKLTTYDCGDGMHYGYAYFVLKEDRKNIKSDRCGQEGARMFSVPEGFNYRWYKEENPDVILSNERTVQVIEDGTYIAECYFVGAGDRGDDSSCSFTCKATAGARYPKADFSYTILERDEDSCITKLQFYNHSCVAKDSLLTATIPDENCENFIWDFGDGTFSTELCPIHEFEHQFAYDVKLTAFIANNECSNEKDSIIHLLTCYNVDTSYINLCEGSSYLWEDTILTTGGNYLKEVDKYHVKILIVNMKPNYDTIINVKICSDEEYNGLNVSGTYIDTLQTEYNCDSIIILNLNVYPSKDTNITVDICSGETYYFNGNNLINEGTYIYQGSTYQGCDSVVNLELVVNPTYNNIVDVEWLGENAFEGYGFVEENSGYYTHYSSSENGCDSSFTLHLLIRRNPIVWMANSFTPMLETNNIFQVYANNDVLKLHSFEIFSRWGTMVFETNDISQGWDGKYKGKYCPQGVYTYRVLYIGKDNLMYEKTGEVMLLY